METVIEREKMKKQKMDEDDMAEKAA